MSKDYKVGYKKPPKETQFKKGHSGNPKGRPKKCDEDFISTFMRVVGEEMVISENGEQKRIPRYEVFIRQLLAQVLKGGNAGLSKLLMDFLINHVQPLQEKEISKNEEKVPQFDNAMEAAAYYREFIKSCK